MDGLPFIPGFRFNDLTVSNYKSYYNIEIILCVETLNN